MRPNKVYPFTVSGSAGGAASVTVRLIIAGAQVVPAELPIDAGNAKEKVTFYVTPLAKGPLRGERLEVLQDGRKIQELHLACMVCTLRPTLIWLMLAFIIPWAILHYLVYAPIGFQPGLNPDATEAYVRNPSKEYAVGKDTPEKRAHRITHFFEDNTPGLGALFGGKSEPGNIDGKDSKKGAEKKDEKHVPSLIESSYLELVRSYREMNQPLAFYLFVLLLVFSLVSFVRRQERRATVQGRTLV